MKSDVRLGIVMLGTGLAVLSAGRLLGAPWSLGVAFVTIGLIDFVRAWRGRITRTRDRLITKRMDQALALQQSDPAAADRMLDDLFLLEGERETAELERLRHDAIHNPTASRDLRRRLEAILETRAAARRHFEKRMAGDARLAHVLNTLEKADSATRQLLAEVQGQAQRLKP